MQYKPKLFYHYFGNKNNNITINDKYDENKNYHFSQVSDLFAR